MGRFIEGGERDQLSLLPASLEDYVERDNPVRVVDAFIDELDLGAIGFTGVTPTATGRPSYHPSTLLKLYLHGYLNRVQSSRRLEQEARRNVEVMWLTGRLAPDFRRSPTFARTTARQLNPSARGSWSSVSTSACSRLQLQRSMEPSSRPSIRGTATSQRQAQAPHGADHGEHRPIPRSSRCG